jgi:hypothetical protein
MKNLMSARVVGEETGEFTIGSEVEEDAAQQLERRG